MSLYMFNIFLLSLDVITQQNGISVPPTHLNAGYSIFFDCVFLWQTNGAVLQWCKHRRGYVGVVHLNNRLCVTTCPLRHNMPTASQHAHCVTTCPLRHNMPTASQHAYCVTTCPLRHNMPTASQHAHCVTTCPLRHNMPTASQHAHCVTTCPLRHNMPTASQHAHCVTTCPLRHNMPTASQHAHCVTTCPLCHNMPTASQHAHCVTTCPTSRQWLLIIQPLMRATKQLSIRNNFWHSFTYVKYDLELYDEYST